MSVCRALILAGIITVMCVSSSESGWYRCGVTDGLPSDYVYEMLEDRVGNLWFGTLGGGVARYEPDLVPPQTVISPRPPELSANTISTFTFAVAFREVEGVKFSHSLDGDP